MIPTCWQWFSLRYINNAIEELLGPELLIPLAWVWTCIYITYKLSCNVDVVGLPITLFVQQRLQTYKYPEPQDNLGLSSLRVGSQFFLFLTNSHVMEIDHILKRKVSHILKAQI